MLSNVKLYFYAGLAIALLAASGYAITKAYESGYTNAASKYELKIAKIAEEQANETKRQADANQQAQDSLTVQLKSLQDQNDTLQKTIDANKKAAAADPHGNSVAVSAAGVRRIRSIRGH